MYQPLAPDMRPVHQYVSRCAHSGSSLSGVVYVEAGDVLRIRAELVHAHLALVMRYHQQPRRCANLQARTHQTLLHCLARRPLLSLSSFHTSLLAKAQYKTSVCAASNLAFLQVVEASSLSSKKIRSQCATLTFRGFHFILPAKARVQRKCICSPKQVSLSTNGSSPAKSQGLHFLYQGTGGWAAHLHGTDSAQLPASAARIKGYSRQQPRHLAPHVPHAHSAVPVAREIQRWRSLQPINRSPSETTATNFLRVQ